MDNVTISTLDTFFEVGTQAFVNHATPSLCKAVFIDVPVTLLQNPASAINTFFAATAAYDVRQKVKESLEPYIVSPYMRAVVAGGAGGVVRTLLSPSPDWGHLIAGITTSASYEMCDAKKACAQSTVVGGAFTFWAETMDAVFRAYMHAPQHQRVRLASAREQLWQGYTTGFLVFASGNLFYGPAMALKNSAHETLLEKLYRWTSSSFGGQTSERRPAPEANSTQRADL